MDSIERLKKWNKDHPEESREAVRRWQKEHRVEQTASTAQYRKRNLEKIREKDRDALRKKRQANPEKYQKALKAWREKNPERAKAISRRSGKKNHPRWRKASPEKFALRHMVQHMLSYSDLSKTRSSYEYIGCSPGFLRNHLESLFKPGMSWENYGQWHVDHIVPLSWWPFKEDPSCLYVASHWTNLQPLWGSDNHKKGNRHL